MGPTILDIRQTPHYRQKQITYNRSLRSYTPQTETKISPVGHTIQHRSYIIRLSHLQTIGPMGTTIYTIQQSDKQT